MYGREYAQVSTEKVKSDKNDPKGYGVQRKMQPNLTNTTVY